MDIVNSAASGSLEQIDIELSQRIEDILVAKNLRGMKHAQQFLTSGYYYRAAKIVDENKGTVLIGTGFPVTDTFETDGPVGAICLYNTLEQCGYNPVLVCGDPLFSALKDDYRCHQLMLGDAKSSVVEVVDILSDLKPDLVISIERPGRTVDGSYRNMRGEDISARCACFDDYIELAQCPTIGIGDGGNEIGMGNIAEQLANSEHFVSIKPSVTRCGELLIADVSNWAAYGLIAFLSLWQRQDLLKTIKPLDILQYLSDKGSVDGVTRLNTLTEDSLEVSAGEDVIAQIRKVCQFNLWD
ncbi:MAG: DUF4392 domain-containing protein [Gammaproteobacteria bacterium]|nr:DUF4392 domain-containing protein [Gammaproteobacteria bacterium]